MNAASALPGGALLAPGGPTADGATDPPGADPGLFVALLAGLIAPAAPPATPAAEASPADARATPAVAAVEATTPRRGLAPTPASPEARSASTAARESGVGLARGADPSALMVRARPGPAVAPDAPADSPASTRAPVAAPDITRQAAATVPHAAGHAAVRPASDAQVHRAVAGFTHGPTTPDAARPARFTPPPGAAGMTAQVTAGGPHVAQASEGRAPIVRLPANMPRDTVTEPRTTAPREHIPITVRPETPAVTAPTGTPAATTPSPVAAPVVREGAEVTVARVTAERLPLPLRPADGHVRVVTGAANVRPEAPGPAAPASPDAPAVEGTVAQTPPAPARSQSDVPALRQGPPAPAEAVASEPAPAVSPRPAPPATDSVPDPAPVVVAPDGEPITSSPTRVMRAPAETATPAAAPPGASAPSAPDAPRTDAQPSESVGEPSVQGRAVAQPSPESDIEPLKAPNGRSTMAPPQREEVAPRPAAGAAAPVRAAEAIGEVGASVHVAPPDAPVDAASPTRPVAQVHIPRIADLPPREGVRHVRIEVDPPELGRCELELSVRDGTVRAVVIAERPETVAALRQAEGQVRATLAEQDVRIAQFDVRHGGGGAGQGAARQPMDRQPPPTAPHMERVPDPPPRRPAVSTRGSSRRVDLVA